MYTVKEYLFPESLEQAYALLQKSRNNCIFAGGSWLRLGRNKFNTAIDITRLGLDTIEHRGDELVIGAAVTLRQLEKSPEAAELFGGALKKALEPIVGVQLRGSATIGANVAARHGFSDPITLLLALDTTLDFYAAGSISLKDYLEGAPKRDILTHIRIKKDGRRAVYLTHRATATDLAILNVAAAVSPDGEFSISVGARPGSARLSPKAALAMAKGGPKSAGDAAAEELCFGSNMRAGSDYRKELCRVLVTRALSALIQREVL